MNLSDEISRDNMSLVTRSGWHLIDLDLTTTYETLIKATKDINFAHGPAADMITDSLRTQVREQLKICPWAQDTMNDLP